MGSRSDLELPPALDGTLRPETCQHIGRTKLLKQHLHRWLVFVIYGASYDAYYTLRVCWCLWNSMRAPFNQVSVFWRTVLNVWRHTMPSSLNRFFFLLAGWNGSRGFWQSLTKRESLRKKDIQSCVANRALPK